MVDCSFPLRLSGKPPMRIFRTQGVEVARDLLRIGYSLFEAEKKCKKGEDIEKLNINTSLITHTRISDTTLADNITNMFNNILDKNISVNLRPSADKDYKKTRQSLKPTKHDTICLFSGGVDSTFGALESLSRYPNQVSLFVAHRDQAGTINIVNHILTFLKKLGIKNETVYAPGMMTGSYAQLRGFLYCLCVGAYSEICNASRIIITECGSTMYQPRFGPFDYITHTTHPIILSTAKKAITLIRGKNVKFITPFEDMTKAEIIAFSKHNALLPETHSCISSRFRNHCGVCYGCVIRRLGAILADVKDAPYRIDILADSGNKVDDDNLISLMRFSYYFLFKRQALKDYSLERIRTYGKHDLFVRQSLDILATLYLLKKQNFAFSPRVLKAYDEYVSLIPVDKLEARVKAVRAALKKPDFSKEVL